MIKSLSKNKVKTIGIVAPASPEDIVFITNKINILKKYNFDIIEGDHLYEKFGYLAGKDQDRATDINNMFKNTDIDAILCFRGGYGSIRMAKYLDLDLIRNNPKIFCGYSDITLLLNYLSKQCDMVTFHGPMANSSLTDEFTERSFLSMLNSSNLEFTYNLDFLNSSFLQNKRDFSGTLVGGNLSMICSTIGTPYEIFFDNSVVIIEEINESPYAIDRMLSQLIYSHKFEHCSAVILGHFTNCGLNDYSKSFSVDNVLAERFKSLNIPVINNFPIGHSYPNIVLPIGAKINYLSKTGTLSLSDDIFA